MIDATLPLTVSIAEGRRAYVDERLANLHRILNKEGYYPILWDSLEKFTESEP
jgi:hypothetical protein